MFYNTVLLCVFFRTFAAAVCANGTAARRNKLIMIWLEHTSGCFLKGCAKAEFPLRYVAVSMAKHRVFHKVNGRET